MAEIGFIGLGNMAKAMIGGMLDRGIVKPEQIVGSAKTKDMRERGKAVRYRYPGGQRGGGGGI